MAINISVLVFLYPKKNELNILFLMGYMSFSVLQRNRTISIDKFYIDIFYIDIFKINNILNICIQIILK